jgi:type IV secretion system protein VirB9
MTLFIITLTWLASAQATLQESRPLPGEHRFRVITYNPNQIHKYVGYYGYQASIIFDEGEEIKTITMGVPDGWQMVPSGRRLFIKPVADDPDDTNTNMLIITNKRIYHFILEAAEVGEEGINDANLVFETRFVYADASTENIQHFDVPDEGPDLSDPSKYNFNYKLSGSDYIAPIRIFDDGEFTYFQFSSKNADVPAFFLVDEEGRESLVNYRVNGDYILVEQVASQFTLRHGSEVTCVFNEAKPFAETPFNKKKKRGFF